MKDSKSFENNLKKLEAITRKLENEDISLDESIALFEEGVKLVKILQCKLNEAERKVEILIKEAEGKYHLKEFGEGEKPEEGD
jgi:exodeoxyribonuclease VII small subunit